MRQGHDINIIKNRYIYACLAGVIVMCMYLLLLLSCHLSPLGDNTWIMYDLKRQYIDFYSYYKRVLSGEGSVLYSFETALGSGMIGFCIYYLSNPFFIIFSFFDIADLPNAVTLVIGLTLVAGAFIMALFLSGNFGKMQEDETEENQKNRGIPLRQGICVIMGSVAWSFSGFLIAHSMNMMWTDVVILLPVIMLAADEVIRTDTPTLKDCGRYVFVLIFMLLFNYYITYQVLLYVACWTLVRLWTLKDPHPVIKIRNLFICTVIPVLLDAVVLLPTFLELANSPKDITELGMEATGRMLTPIDLFSKLFALAYDSVQPRFGLPQIYSGVLILIPAILYFFDRLISIRERLGRLVIILIMSVSFCVDPINLFWHALMEPSGHPYRQAPLFVFTVILCAYEYLSGIGIKKGEAAAKTEKKHLYRIYLLVFAISEIMLISVFMKGYDYTGKKMFILNQALIIGGMMLLFMAECIISESLSKMIMIGVSFVLCAELLVNAIFTYPFIAMNAEKMSYYQNKIRSTETVVKKIKEADTGFYRMENLTPRQQNDAMMYGYNGVTHYSSAGMTYVRYFLQKCGFNDDALYTHYGHDNTVTMDMMLGIRYIITEDESPVHCDYYKMESYDNETVSVYRNPYALPLAVAVDEDFLTGITDINDPRTIDKDPFSLQEDIVGRLAGHEADLFIPLDQDIVVSESYMEADLTVSVNGEVYMYLNGIMDKIQGLAVYMDDEILTGYGNLSSYKVLNLGYHNAGDKIRIRIEADSDKADFGEPIFVTEDMDSVRELYEEILKRGLSVELISPSSVKINDIPDGTGIFMTIPYEKGWNIEGTSVYGALMYLRPGDLSSAFPKKEMILRFVPKGMYTGMIISLITLVFCISYAAVYKNRTAHRKKYETVAGQ